MPLVNWLKNSKLFRGHLLMVKLIFRYIIVSFLDLVIDNIVANLLYIDLLRGTGLLNIGELAT